jgi:hypothetical protein
MSAKIDDIFNDAARNLKQDDSTSSSAFARVPESRVMADILFEASDLQDDIVLSLFPMIKLKRER